MTSSLLFGLAMYFLRTPGCGGLGFLGVSGRVGAKPDREFLGARDHVDVETDPDRLADLVAGAFGVVIEALETSDSLEGRVGRLVVLVLGAWVGVFMLDRVGGRGGGGGVAETLPLRCLEANVGAVTDELSVGPGPETARLDDIDIRLDVRFALGVSSRLEMDRRPGTGGGASFPPRTFKVKDKFW